MTAKGKSNAGAPRKFKKELIAEALRASGGIHTIAASMVEEATDKSCAPNTIRNYLDYYPDLAELKDQIEEKNFDIAVGGLLNQIRAENLTAIIFYIKQKGKKFGWGETIAFEGTVKTEPNAEHLANLDKLPLDDQRAILDMINRARDQHESDGDET